MTAWKQLRRKEKKEAKKRKFPLPKPNYVNSRR